MKKTKKQSEISLRSFVTIAVVFGLFGYIARIMGFGSMLNTLVKTAHDLLLNTVFFIMVIAVLTDALSKIFSEFGVIALISKVTSSIMKSLYNSLGASALGILTIFLSDNPAVIGFAKDKGFVKYFKGYQLPTLCNLGTSFGVGFIVWIFISSLGSRVEFLKAAPLGSSGAVVGPVIPVRTMVHLTEKFYGGSDEDVEIEGEQNDEEKEDLTLMEKILNLVFGNGKPGMQAGINIIPGVVVICALVVILTSTGTVESGTIVYTRAIYEGVGLIPKISVASNPVLKLLFGFSSSECIAFSFTILGSVGATLSLVPKLLEENLITGNGIAVFTAPGMCWPGYLSTRVRMTDTLDARKLASKAVPSCTIGRITARISAHFLYLLLE